MSTVEFGSFRLELHRRALTRNGKFVPLAPRLLDVLCCLAGAQDHILNKRELMDSIWPHADIAENHLHVLMSELRKALGHDGREHLVTVPGYGYRLIVTAAVRASGNARRERPKVAILPIRNLAADALQAPICVGIMEDLAADLCRTRWISTLLLDASRANGKRALQADVSYLVAGSLRRVGDTFRISLRLVETTTGALIWSARSDMPHDAGLPQWDQVTTAAALAIETAILDKEQRRLLAESAESSQAWELFARATWHFTRARFHDNELARMLLERAIQIDASFSQAHQWLAYTHIQYGNHYRTCSVDQACDVAEAAAANALDADCADAGSHASLGFVAKVAGDPQRGLTCAEQALALNPSDGDGLRLMGGCQIALGQHAAGATALLLSTRLRPHDPQNWRALEHLGSSAHMQGDYEAAVAYCYASHRLNQHQILSYPWLISSLARLGRIAEAREVIAKAQAGKGPRPFDECAQYRPLYLPQDSYDRVLEGMRLAGWRE